jgi:hypothetical protein
VVPSSIADVESVYELWIVRRQILLGDLGGSSVFRMEWYLPVCLES